MKLFVTCIFTLIFNSLSAQLIYETVGVEYDSAWEYKSLKLIPIRSKGPGGRGGPVFMSLKNALQQGLATISERGSASTENVHWLRIQNKSKNSLFVASGQTITGGRQDRMITRDTVLTPNGGDQYVPVMCIEENRWSDKERKLIYSNYANPRLRKVLDSSRNQVLVWKEIFAQLDSADFRSSTFAYSAISLNKEVQLKEKAYFDYFIDKFKRSDSSITGFVCVSGDKVIGTDIFSDRAMFYDELEPLLYGYINEAVMNGAPPIMEREEIILFMDKILTNETLQEEYCRKNGKIFRAAGKVLHVTAY